VQTLVERVKDRGNQVALVDELGSWTWAELDVRLNRLINGLRGLGLGLGDTVALLGGNRHEWCEVTAATGTTGMVVVPVNWHFSADEVAYVLEDSGARALVADAEFAATARDAAERAGIDIRIAFGGPIDGFSDYEELLAAASPDEPAELVAGTPMFYTSGTTGRPKGVRSSAFAVGGDVAERAAGLELLMGLYQVPPNGVVLCNAPLYHAGPLAMCLVPFLVGSTLILRRHWDAEETLRLIDEHGVTTYYAVPTHFTRLLKLPEEVRASFSGDSLRWVIHTAAPCPPEVKRRMIEWWGPVIRELYGASEGAGVGAFVDSQDWLDHPGTVGRALPTCEILVIGDDGERLGPGETGQIYMRSLLGTDFEYLGDEDKTASAHLEPGVFSFGDVGHLDDEGYLYLSDRKIDMIISGGVNIYPAEVEAVLATHPSVADVGVFGVPDDDFGEQVKAAVELVDGVDPAEAEADLRRLCREQLAGYMAPRSYDFGPLPRTATGKLPKRALRAPYWEGTGRTI
jgi:long-chain acyl-CoA synthetase